MKHLNPTNSAGGGRELVEVKIMGRSLSDRLIGCLIQGKLYIVGYQRKQKNQLNGLDTFLRRCKELLPR